MEKEVKIDLSKLKSDSELFEQDLEELLDIPENEESILAECKKYDSVEYPIELRQVTDHGQKIWVAEHPGLPGCITHGNSKEEALLNLEDAKKGYIYDCIADGRTVPLPDSIKEIENFSGKFVVRLPRELHYRITKMAELNDVSLNQQIIYMLSKTLEGERTNEVLNKVLEEMEAIKTELTSDANQLYYRDYLKSIGVTTADRTNKYAIGFVEQEYSVNKRSSLDTSSITLPKYNC